MPSTSAAPTASFSLRKLIQTRRHQDDSITEDEIIATEEDSRSPARKKSIALFLTPRRGSASSATNTTILSRSSVDVSRSPSPSPLASVTPDCPRSSLDYPPAKSDREVKDTTHSTERIRASRSTHDCPRSPVLTLADLDRKPSPTAMDELRESFLRSPSPTPNEESRSPQIEPLDLSTASRPSLSLSSQSTTPMNSKRFTREWSEGVKHFILETDQAFDFGGAPVSSLSNSFDLPRIEEHGLVIDTKANLSNPELVSPKCTTSPPFEESEDETVVEDGKQVVMEEEKEVIRGSLEDSSSRKSRDSSASDKRERRRSRSVPPPIPPKKDRELAPTTEKPLPSPRLFNRNHQSKLSISHNMTPPLPALSKNCPRTPALVHQESTSSRKSHARNNSANANNEKGRRPSKGGRWAFPDNMTDLFTGKGFRKVEADEMLTPQQLAKLKREREAIRKSQMAKTSSQRRRDTVTRVELDASKPARLTELDARDATGLTPEPSPCSVATMSRSPIPEEDGLDEMEVIDEADEKEHAGLATVDLLTVPEGNEQAPALPSKNPRRLTPPPNTKLPDLPKPLSIKKSNVNEFLPEEDDEHVYFKSTPFSLTSPGFRHGRIAVPKNDGRGAVTMDETLDWTAFQMAILGAGDMEADMFDDEDLKLTDDIVSWFDDFGFEHEGLLIPEMIPSPRSSHSTISSVESDNDLSIDTVDEPQPLWVPNNNLTTEVYDSTKFFRSTGLRSWTLDGAPKTRRASTPPPLPMALPDRKASVVSPNLVSPRSPMEPLVLGGDNGDLDDDDIHHEEQAQMGYNLHNDLGDFLQWEAQAFGVGYYGAH